MIMSRKFQRESVMLVSNERKGRFIHMETRTKKKRKACVNVNECVACGCCVKVCPKGAIQIRKGIAADVDLEKCVGCGMCARECPASVIEVQEVQV